MKTNVTETTNRMIDRAYTLPGSKSTPEVPDGSAMAITSAASMAMSAHPYLTRMAMLSWSSFLSDCIVDKVCFFRSPSPSLPSMGPWIVLQKDEWPRTLYKLR